MPKQTAFTSFINSDDRWKRLFKAALVERDRSALPARLQEAKHAIMDRIEDSIDSASYAERRLLLGALNTINELQRLADVNEQARPEPSQALGQAA